MKCRCGDKVSLHVKFEDPLKGHIAKVLVFRKDFFIPNHAMVEVKETDFKIPWPDQEIEKDKWYGGSQAHFTGLGDDWNKKWKEQDFFFEVFVGDKHKKSETITIEPFKNEKTAARTATVKLLETEEVIFQLHGDSGIRRVPYYKIKDLEEKPLDFKSKFDIELKDGEVVLTVRIKWEFIYDYDKLSDDDRKKEVVKYLYDWLDSTGKKSHFSGFEKDFRQTVLKHWNAEFKRFILHRKKCARGEKCNCQKGCCKFGLRLNLEDGDYTTVKVKLGVGRANHLAFYTLERTPGYTWPHEVGHHLGLPDEYLGGHIAAGPKGQLFKKKDPYSLMGEGTSIKKEYIEFIVDQWIKEATGEDFEVLEVLK